MYDFLGVRTDTNYRPYYRPDPPGPVMPDYPRPDQTYFELTFALSVVVDAPGKDFVFFELGGAYGHWAVKVARAVTLATANDVKLTVVEMEPHRFDWIAQHFRNNGLDPQKHHLVNVALSDHNGESMFIPEGEVQYDYGLQLARGGLLRSTVLSVNASGTSSSAESVGNRVKCLRLSDLLRPCARVDLIHMDIQGEELTVIREARKLLQERVANLIVATHSWRLHVMVRALLRRDGWIVETDYFPHGLRRTPFGDIYFLDGLLTLRSPAMGR